MKDENEKQNVEIKEDSLKMTRREVGTELKRFK